MDLVAEHERARTGAGLLELSDEAWIRASGEGARDFLQRLVANDVLSLGIGQGRRSLLLDAKGHVQSDLRILRTGEAELLIEAPASAREQTLKMLTLYGIADPVEFEDLAPSRALFCLVGPRSKEVLAALVPGGIELARELDHAIVSLRGNGDARVVLHDRSGRSGYDLVVPVAHAPAVRDSLLAELATRGGGPISERALDLLRLEAGRPRFGADFGPETIPQEARLEEKEADALSFEKGCFLGQETVARLRFRGHVNKLLVGLVSDRDLAGGAALRKDGKEIGRVTSAARSPLLGGKTIALGYVRREQANPGVELEAASGESWAPVRVVALPFAAA